MNNNNNAKTGNGPMGPTLQPPNTDVALCRRLDAAIRELLIRYNGTYEESLADWFLALKLVEPRLEHPRQLVDTFETLYRDGLIQLHTKTGSYDGGDDSFFLHARFTATLTTRGWIKRS